MRVRREQLRRVGRIAVAGVLTAALAGTLATTTTTASADDPDTDFMIDRHDLEFIMNQIQIAEHHSMGEDLLCDDRADMSWTCVPDPKLPYGLRTVDGSFNNLFPARKNYGAAHQAFPRLVQGTQFHGAEPLSFDPDGPGPRTAGEETSYENTSGFVEDSQPREISNLIVDQTDRNPAALAAMAEVPGSQLVDLQPIVDLPDVPRQQGVFIPDVATDEGLSAPFNSWFTLFGQFFDHGLDLVSKGGNGTVAVTLKPGDDLYRPGNPHANIIYLSRATNRPNGDREGTNRTTPFVDQNQTYTSHPSHQVFIREYSDDAKPTGQLLDGTVDEGMPTWADVKSQSAAKLGIELDDMDAVAVPMVLTDPYGHFVPGPNGLPQLVLPGAETVPEGCEAAGETILCEGNLESPIDASLAMDAGVAFLDDIAHTAVPNTGGTYDDALLSRHFITGDGRGNENIGLTSVHHVFHSEHNRLRAHIDEQLEEIRATGNADDVAFVERWHDESGVWGYGERLFQAARYVTEMEYQHLVFEEFARKIQPNIDAGPLNESLYHADINPAVKAEFAHVVYRFGHSMLTENVDRVGHGTEGPLPLIDAFLNPDEFAPGDMTADEGSAAVIEGMMNQTGNMIDEFVTDTLRNNLLGVPMDLASINLARGRDTRMPSLQAARRSFYAQGANPALKPYANWEEFRLELKHRGSIGNFVAAYGIHPTLDAATTVDAKRAAAAALVADPAFMTLPSAQSGLEDVDMWMGGLGERPAPFGGMLGTTFNHVFEEHMEDLQNGDRFYYLNRNQGLNLFHQLEANSFAELVMRNTSAENLPVDMFASQDLTIDMANMPAEGIENFNLLDGWWRWDGPEHITIHGTDGDDSIRAGEGDDALWGHRGNDRVEGGIGNDGIHGGPGNDLLTDVFGDDVIHAGPGHDAIDTGHGFDIAFGQSGSDFVLHGQEVTQSFAGQGPDYILGGNAGDLMTGNEDHDWLDGGKGADLVQGDNAFTFQNDPVGGADVLIGGSGNDDHDAEGGDDIMSNNGRDRHAGMLGFDWVTHQHDPDPVDADLDVLIFQPPNVTLMRSRFMNVEGLSGWTENDVLRGRRHPGDQAFPTSGKGHELTQAQLTRVTGLRQLLSAGHQLDPANPDALPNIPKYATSFMATNQTGNILLGGGGSDIMEGRSGDDYIDGNAALEVYLEYGGVRYESMSDLQQGVFAGEIDPSQISIQRRIVQQDDDAIDIAQYADVRDQHTITENGDGTWRVAHVDEDAGGLQSGVDILRNVERVQFADESVDLVELEGTAASGHMTFSTDQPVEDEPITVTGHFTDPDGVDEDSISYTWQYGDDEGEFTPSVNGVGDTFTPGDPEAGFTLRVIATFTDGAGNLETITSHTTLPVKNVNDPVTGLVVDPGNPWVGGQVTASGLVDNDGTHNDDGDLTVKFTYQWQSGTAGGSFSNIAGATNETYTVRQVDAGKSLRVRVTFTDNLGTKEDITSPATEAVTAAPVVPPSPLLGAASASGSTSATVTWTPPEENGGAEIIGFDLRILRNGGEDRLIEAISPETTSHEVTGLTAGTPYKFQVRALNVAGPGDWSTESDPVTLSAPVPVNRPASGNPAVRVSTNKSMLRVTRGSMGDQDGIGAATYTWQQRSAGRWVKVSEAPTLKISNALRGRSVRVVARFTDGAGFTERRPSAAVTVPRVAPSRPVVRKVAMGKVGGPKTFRVRWAPPMASGGSAVRRYRLVAVRAANGRKVAVKVLGANRRAVTFRVPAGAFRVQIRAVNGIGSSSATVTRKIRAR